MIPIQTFKTGMVVLLFTCLTLWVLFRNWFPEAPLTPTESTVVVGGVLLFWAGVVKVFTLATPVAKRFVAYIKSKRSNSSQTPTALLAVFLLFGTTQTSQAQKQKQPTDEPVAVVVKASSPVVGQNSIVTLTAYGPLGKKVNARWSVDIGEVQEDRYKTMWVMGNAPLGEHTATCRWSVGGKQGQTQLTITVTDYQLYNNAVGTETYLSRNYLYEFREEEPLNGLSSYLLLRTRPSAANRDRYRAVLREYLRQVQSWTAVRRYVESKDMNVFYLPVNSDKVDNDMKLFDSLTDSYCDKVMDEQYDYARAQVFLQKAGITKGDGPFIVCTRKPLSKWGALEKNAPKSKAWVQDLSGVPPRLITLWIREFAEQTIQERLWTDNTLEQIPLRVRILIGNLADALPDVQAALGSWATWSVEKK